MFPELQAFVPNAEIHALTQKSPPKFGHALKEYFALDPDYVNLNHGFYGSCPSSVMEFAFDLGRKIERNPDYFDRVAVKPMLAKIREQLADFIGVKPSEVVIVHNASHGVNTVLWNIEWAPEDTIVITTTTYYAIDAAVKFIHDKAPHPSISHFPLLHPTTKEDILRSWEAHIQALAEHKRSPDGSPNANPAPTGKIVAIIDTISSNPGILNPWVDMVKIAKRHGALAVVDGAHSLGQEVDLKGKLEEADPDFFLYAKRGAAVFYVPESIVRASFPVSPYYVSPKDRTSPSDNFVVQHNLTATIDWSNFFTIPAALRFRAWLGGEAAINAYTHKLAFEGGKRIAEILQTEMMYPDEGSEMELSMVNVALPLPAFGKVIGPGAGGEISKEEYAFQMKVQGLIQRKLLEERNLGPTRYYHNGRLWLRISGQVWLEMEDFEKVGWGVKEVCEEVIEELQLEKFEPAKKQ
ncbi:PLP-dependent transferase [Schizophyllum commune Tattone D]|nr:PLP-dependent transferase [Schizophyllum commune Tattone D]